MMNIIWKFVYSSNDDEDKKKKKDSKYQLAIFILDYFTNNTNTRTFRCVHFSNVPYSLYRRGLRKSNQ